MTSITAYVLTGGDPRAAVLDVHRDGPLTGPLSLTVLWYRAADDHGVRVADTASILHVLTGTAWTTTDQLAAVHIHHLTADPDHPLGCHIIVTELTREEPVLP